VFVAVVSPPKSTARKSRLLTQWNVHPLIGFMGKKKKPTKKVYSLSVLLLSNYELFFILRGAFLNSQHTKSLLINHQ